MTGSADVGWTPLTELAADTEMPPERVTYGRRHLPDALRRVAMFPLILIGVSVLLFLTSRVIPSDPVRMILGDSAPQSTKEAIRRQLGLDRPLPVQYFKYVDGIVHGNFGISLQFRLPVSSLIATAFPATLELVLAGAVVTIVLAFFFGLLSSAFRNTWVDTTCRFVAMLAASAPPFFVGIVCILVFGFYLHWFPISGRGDPADLHHLILPAIVLGMRHAGSSARLLRSTMIDVMHQEYIQSARARGIRRRTVLLKYALRNAVVPTITDLGVSLADVIGSVILIETIFAWPGIGRLVYLGIYWNDFPVLSAAVIVLLTYALVVNLVVDILYGVIDPRMNRVSVP